MKKILKLTVILCLVCAIVAGVLGVVNYLTEDKIAEQQQKKTDLAYAAVLESPEGYEAMSEENLAQLKAEQPGFETIDSISAAKNGAGWVVVSSFSGAQSKITMAVGVSAEDFTCTGISIIKHAETSGLGANAASSGQVGINFRAQFVGQDETVATKKANGTVDALAGATITSNAVCGATSTSILAARAAAEMG